MSALSRLFAPAAPSVGLDIASDRVTLARLDAGGPGATVTAWTTEPLPPGCVTPALNAQNVSDRSAVAEAIRRGLERIGRARSAAVIVPDTIAKVSLLHFEQVPDKTPELLELIRWQVRKSVPFKVEEARLTWARGAVVNGAQEFVVALARRDIVEEYEAVCSDAGVHAGIVDLSTFNLANAVMAAGSAPAGDWLLVNVARDYFTIAVMRGTALIFFRHRGTEGDGSLADVVHQSAMYYEDRIRGQGFERVVLAGVGRSAAPDSSDAPPSADVERVRRELEQRLRVGVETIDPRPGIALADRVSPSAAVLDTLAPLAGVLLRERTA
jgi:type IV pilus assembly protein PilM